MAYLAVLSASVEFCPSNLFVSSAAAEAQRPISGRPTCIRRSSIRTPAKPIKIGTRCRLGSDQSGSWPSDFLRRRMARQAAPRFPDKGGKQPASAAFSANWRDHARPESRWSSTRTMDVLTKEPQAPPWRASRHADFRSIERTLTRFEARRTRPPPGVPPSAWTVPGQKRSRRVSASDSAGS
jgi:hypothetical protein